MATAEFFARELVSSNPPYAEHANQVARKELRGAARVKSRHPPRRARWLLGAGPETLSAYNISRSCGRTKGENDGKLRWGHSDIALTCSQVQSCVSCDFPGRAEIRDGHSDIIEALSATHRRSAVASALRRGQSWRSCSTTVFSLTLRRKSAHEASERPHRGHRPQGPGHPQSGN